MVMGCTVNEVEDKTVWQEATKAVLEANIAGMEDIYVVEIGWETPGQGLSAHFCHPPMQLHLPCPSFSVQCLLLSRISSQKLTFYFSLPFLFC